MTRRRQQWIARAWADLPLRRKGLAVIAIPLVALLFTTMAYILVQRQEATTHGRVAHALEVRVALQRTSRLLNDAETGMQEYHQSANATDLAPYEAARLGLPDSLARLAALVRDSPLQVAQVARLSDLATRQMDALVILRDGSGPREATQLELTNTMRALRVESDGIFAEEARLLTAQMVQATTTSNWGLGAITLGLLSGLLGGIGATLLFTASTTRRIQQLVVDAEWLAAGQQLAADAERLAADEVGQLARGLAEAAAALAAREHALLREINLHLEQGVQSQKVELREQTNTLARQDVDLAATNHVLARQTVEMRAQTNTLARQDVDLAATNRVLAHQTVELREQTDTLARQATDLAANNRVLAQQTVELREQTEALARQAADLVATNRVLAQQHEENEMFVYSVSHDLRAPLVNLQGFSQELALVGQDLRSLLSMDGVPPAIHQRGLTLLNEDMADALRFIQAGVARLSTIIDALLRLSRAGRVEYQRQRVDLNPIVVRVTDSLRESLNARGARVALTPLPQTWGDPTALEQVFANLIGNALAYLDPARPGQIAVGSMPTRGNDTDDCSATGQTYFVRDNGVGIPDHAQVKIFQAFQRLNPEGVPGEGLGLALVRRVVERHGGAIRVESTEGVGSTFFVELPELTPEGAHDATG